MKGVLMMRVTEEVVVRRVMVMLDVEWWVGFDKLDQVTPFTQVLGNRSQFSS